MKSNFLKLLKIQFQNQSVWNQLRHEKDSKKRGKAVGGLVGIIILVLCLVGMSFLIGIGYGALGMAYVLPGFSLAIVSLVVLFFSFIKASGFLFAFKDYDLLMSLPIKPQWIISSKFLYMYINNILISAGVLLPIGGAYIFWNTPDSIGEGIIAGGMWLLLSLFAPLIPMTIASVFGTIAVAISAKSRFKVFIEALVSIVFLILIIGLNVFLRSSATESEFILKVEDMGTMVQEKMHSLYPISAIADEAINEGNIFFMLLFIGISLAVYYAFVKVVTIKYSALNTALMTKAKRKNYKMTAQKSRSVVIAIVYKEYKRFISSTPYMMNSGIGMILVVIASVLCAVVGIEKFAQGMDISFLREEFSGAVPFILIMMLTMTCTSSMSLSLEGKNLWIIQSLPISTKQVLQGKMLFNILLLLPGTVIMCVCMVIAIKLPVWYFFLYLFVSLVMVVFSSVIGMWFNIWFPKYEWENEVEVVKQSMSATLGVFVNMLTQVALMFLAILFSVIWGPVPAVLIISVLFIGITWLMYGLMMRKERTFA